MAAPAKSASPAPEAKTEKPASRDQQPAARRGAAGTSAADPIERLQGKVGNQAVGRLFAHKPPAGGGTRLPLHVRAQMERQFGEDFSTVRIHDGYRAAEVADALQAKAYTFGEDIVFGRERYAPETFNGRQLLAHELAHVVQQRRGGIAPSFESGNAVEVAARSAARAVVSGSAAIVVHGASGVGVAREKEDDPEIARALSTWTSFDHETEEEARRKPQRSPKRESEREVKIPASDAPPASNKVDPVLRDKSRKLRELRLRALKQMRRARWRGQDPSDYDAHLDTPDTKKYYGQARAANRADAESRAAYQNQRHAELVQNQTAMSHEDMFNKTLAQRGFEAAPGIGQRDEVQRQYKLLKRDIAADPETPRVDALFAQNKDLQREIAKIDRDAKKQGKISEEAKARRDKLALTLEANKESIKSSHVTAMRVRARALHDKIAISGLNDPDARRQPSKGAPAGRGENTYAVLQIVGKDGKILAAATGKNTSQGHAEQNAINQLERDIKRMPGGKLPPGAHVEVVGDQVVCTEVCKPSLRSFAERHHIERVDGYTFHSVPRDAEGNPGEAVSAKTTGRNATIASVAGRGLEKKHEPIYPQGAGGDVLTEGEKHRHAQRTKEPKQKPKSASSAEAASKSPPTAAKGKRGRAAQNQTASPEAAKPARQRKPKATGKAPDTAPDKATPRRRSAAPTASDADASSPVRRAAAPRVSKAKAPSEAEQPVPRKAAPRKASPKKASPKKAVQTPTPPVPKSAAPTTTEPPAPKRKPTPPQNTRPAVKPPVIGGGAIAPSPVAKARAQQQAQAAGAPNPTTPAVKLQPPANTNTPPAAHPGNAPQSSGRSREFARGGGVFLAPGTAGGSANFGVNTTQDRGKGITTGQSASFDGAVSVDVAEIADSNPKKYRVTLRVDLNGQLGVSANKTSSGENANIGAWAQAGASVSGSFSHEMSAEDAEAYRAAARTGAGGQYQELEIARLLATHRADAAGSLLQQINAAKGSADAAKHLAKGDVAQVAVRASGGGGLNAGVGKAGGSGAGISFGLFSNGTIERRIEQRNGKIVVTMRVLSEKGRTMGATGSEGVASFGYSNTRADNATRSVSFSLDPNDPNFDARFNSITAASSIEQLDALRGTHKDLVSGTGTGKGKSEGNNVSAGVLGVGLRFSDSGSYNEEKIVDERGVSHRYEGTGGGGLDLTVGGRTASSFKKSDTFVADVGPDNTATGETSSTRRETDLGRTADKLTQSFAKNPLTTTTGLLTGKTPVLQERADTSGAALTNDSFSQLALLAEDGYAWNHAWASNMGAFEDWQKTRQKVLAAKGNRDGIAKAMAEFEHGGSGRSGTVERALGGTGIVFEFPDEIADQKEVYDNFVVGNPLGHAHELAERGQQEAALNELRNANDKLGKLRAAAMAHSGAFESDAKLAQMLGHVDDRRSQLRSEISKLTPKAPAPAPAVGLAGPPAPPEIQQAEEEQRKKMDELLAHQVEIIGNLGIMRSREQGTISKIHAEMDSFHWDHLSASIEMAEALKRVKDSYDAWDKEVDKLKTIFKDRGEDPAKADAFKPNRSQWDAVNAQWKTW